MRECIFNFKMSSYVFQGNPGASSEDEHNQLTLAQHGFSMYSNPKASVSLLISN